MLPVIEFWIVVWFGVGLSQSDKMLQILSDFGIVTINIYYEEQFNSSQQQVNTNKWLKRTIYIIIGIMELSSSEYIYLHDLKIYKSVQRFYFSSSDFRNRLEKFLIYHESNFMFNFQNMRVRGVSKDGSLPSRQSKSVLFDHRFNYHPLTDNPGCILTADIMCLSRYLLYTSLPALTFVNTGSSAD